MIILGIETSCDETAAAVVENGTMILSNVVASSADMHAKTGGIIPEQAARAQLQSIIPTISRAIAEAASISNPSTYSGQVFQFPISNECQKGINEFTKKHIDAIAITVGPGLIGSLLVGVETAKTLSYLWNKPIIPVNHLPAHLYANWLEPKTLNKKHRTKNKVPQFPAIALVVSGGHTDLVLMRDHPSAYSRQVENLKWIGGTRDDAAGEAFDKTARLLGLPYPGGPSIAKAALKCPSFDDDFQPLAKLPRPMIHKDNFDFSFSGLKTAILREVQKLKSANDINNESVAFLAAETQEAIVDVLVAKTLRAVKKYKPKSLLLAGGVAANKRLTEKFKLEIVNCELEIDFFVPPPHLCTDNAAYIAGCAYFNNSSVAWQNIKANPQLTITGE